jgi:hypothetical protein
MNSRERRVAISDCVLQLLFSHPVLSISGVIVAGARQPGISVVAGVIGVKPSVVSVRVLRRCRSPRDDELMRVEARPFIGLEHVIGEAVLLGDLKVGINLRLGNVGEALCVLFIVLVATWRRDRAAPEQVGPAVFLKHDDDVVEVRQCLRVNERCTEHKLGTKCFWQRTSWEGSSLFGN